MSLNELEKYLWDSANFLRGHIDAGDYKQYIFPLLFLKRLSDVWDEEFAESIKEYGEDYKDEHRFVIPHGSHWENIRETTTNVGEKILKAMHSIENANKDSLYGIFGDAQWTNKDRLPDKMLIDLLEHFSKKTLSTSNVPDDELGTAYEYLIKKFADDSGHTAQEFYSNRTLVNLMARILDAKPGDSVYDPTCGTGGMLLTTATHLKDLGKEYRNLKLYGQEINLITSSIARMNMFMHGIVDFKIARGNTLEQPAFIENDKLEQYDIVLANPPYSIKRWNRDLWSNDPYGRAIWGTPPQGCADYAFIQHIVASMNVTGKAAILLPHGVLFRDSESELRRQMIESDIVECVLGLGANLFYNSPMEACVLFLNKNKKAERQNKILFINAVNEVKKEKTMSYLEMNHIEKIENAYTSDNDIEYFSKWVSVEEIKQKGWTLSLPFYVRPQNNISLSTGENLSELTTSLKRNLKKSREQFGDFRKQLKEYGIHVD
ncbi:type I restriction-modification system subunit M (plasmid) [Exiguobacterium aurantiacum]|uniref:site-specific DNA-methyltransferase (adenine-specific) n=1 Tax=Exiguobacterium aurantiacum TaxID=33987 RepID=A0ABY5FTB8_9BACL|nr:class I SAM-dependent DNA methyltransferase [Exiguobacterium aurantiacum]UTT44625.1 type I restriction-modification system subunit M [Exiguobacterium aurantiacum]